MIDMIICIIINYIHNIYIYIHTYRCYPVCLFPALLWPFEIRDIPMRTSSYHPSYWSWCVLVSHFEHREHFAPSLDARGAGGLFVASTGWATNGPNCSWLVVNNQLTGDKYEWATPNVTPVTLHHFPCWGQIQQPAKACLFWLQSLFRRRRGGLFNGPWSKVKEPKPFPAAEASEKAEKAAFPDPAGLSRLSSCPENELKTWQQCQMVWPTETQKLSTSFLCRGAEFRLVYQVLPSQNANLLGV